MEILNEILNTKKIIKVYSGANYACRCGCRGVYHYPSTDLDNDEMWDDVIFARDLVDSGATVELGDGYINIPYGANAAITIYFE